MRSRLPLPATAGNTEIAGRRALDLLGSRRNDAYEAALAALREDTQEWWAEMLACDPGELEKDEVAGTADAEGLRRFLEAEVLPWFETRKKELANRPFIREQALGEAFDADKLERLGRYEVHLDRKLALAGQARPPPPFVRHPLARFSNGNGLRRGAGV